MSHWTVTATGPSAGAPDPFEVRRAAAFLFAPGSIHEVRSLPSGVHFPVNGSNPEAVVQTVADLASFGPAGIYYSLNPIRPDTNGACKVGDVTSRRWLLIDVDPVKPKDFADQSSTDGEKEAVESTALSVAMDLARRGWPAPVRIDSGNGYHLLYRLDLPNDETSRLLIRDILKALADQHDTPGATIDRKVFNASRIAKLPGTWARKGISTPDRPHRPCRLLEVPDPILVVTAEQLADVANADATPLPTNMIPDGHFKVTAVNGDDHHSAYVRSAVEKEVGRVAMAPEGERNTITNEASFKLGTLLHTGYTTRDEVETSLLLAAVRAGLGTDEARKTITSGLDAGILKPREIADRPAVGGNGKASHWGAPPIVGPDGLPADADLVTVRLSDVVAVPVRWLMPGKIPLGKLTIVAGQQKLGKSFLTMDFAARVSTGEVIPCGRGECFPHGSVVILSGEDDLDDTIKPRLVAAGADCAKIHALTTVRYSDGTFGPFNLGFVPHLERAIVRLGDTILVVIDPITQFVGAKVDDHKASQIRAVLGPLRELAARRRVAILIVTHLNKSSGTNALNRVINSGAYTAMARANWLVVRDPDNPRRRLMLDAGNNLAEDPTGLAFKIVDGRVEWEDTPVKMDADEALRNEVDGRKEVNRRENPSKVEQAEAWLNDLLPPGGPEVLSDAVFEQGTAKGFSRKTLFAAKERLGVKARKTGFQGKWSWYRDPQEPQINGQTPGGDP